MNTGAARLYGARQHKSLRTILGSVYGDVRVERVAQIAADQQRARYRRPGRCRRQMKCGGLAKDILDKGSSLFGRALNQVRHYRRLVDGCQEVTVDRLVMILLPFRVG